MAILKFYLFPNLFYPHFISLLLIIFQDMAFPIFQMNLSNQLVVK